MGADGGSSMVRRAARAGKPGSRELLGLLGSGAFGCRPPRLEARQPARWDEVGLGRGSLVIQLPKLRRRLFELHTI